MVLRIVQKWLLGSPRVFSVTCNLEKLSLSTMPFWTTVQLGVHPPLCFEGPEHYPCPLPCLRVTHMPFFCSDASPTRSHLDTLGLGFLWLEKQNSRTSAAKALTKCPKGLYPLEGNKARPKHAKCPFKSALTPSSRVYLHKWSLQSRVLVLPGI